MVIVRYEAGRRAHASSVEKIRSVLEDYGVVFLGENSHMTQPTVALRQGLTSEDQRKNAKRRLGSKTPESKR